MITEKAFAKLNLSLDLVGKREDGYHLIRTVMQTVTLCDVLSFRTLKESGIRITCNKPYIPTDERNIVYKIAAAFMEKYGITSGVHINLKKHIPSGAGLGGGSSDGACTLNMLCRSFGVEMSTEQKVEFTKNIGADIPFFFYGGTALCEGIGEKVTPLAPLPECWVVIVKPPRSISTPAVYKSPLTAENFGGNSTQNVIDAMRKNSLRSVASSMQNALEPAAMDICADIQSIKQGLLEKGAIASMMSGSGSAVFGIFTNHKAARAAREHFLESYRDAYIAKPV